MTPEIEEVIRALEEERDEWRKKAEHRAGFALVEVKKRESAEAERDAALADNAAKDEALGVISTTLEDKALRVISVSQHTVDAQRTVIETAHRLATEARVQPHPGAALLEGHRKALEAERGARVRAERDIAEERARTEAWVSNVREVEKALGLDTPNGMTIADARRVLVRARNEGLEKAAAHLRSLFPEHTILPTSRAIVLKAANAIDAMKEPEP